MIILCPTTEAFASGEGLAGKGSEADDFRALARALRAETPVAMKRVERPGKMTGSI